jgi:lysozyme
MSLIRRRAISVLLVLAGLWAFAAVPADHQPAAQSTSYLNGVDVSHYQGTINWSSVKNSGRTFAFAKATEGLTYTDPQFAYNWRNMQAVGLVRGAYHFCHPGEDPIAQANFFYNTVQPTSGDLQMTGDIEVNDGQSVSQIQSWGIQFARQIQALTGRPGIIYTYYYFWVDDCGDPNGNLNCPLWIATYGPSPLVPHAWSTWSFWQYTDTGRCPGISGNVDLDYFNGSMSQLLALTLP